MEFLVTKQLKEVPTRYVTYFCIQILFYIISDKLFKLYHFITLEDYNVISPLTIEPWKRAVLSTVSYTRCTAHQNNDTKKQTHDTQNNGLNMYRNNAVNITVGGHNSSW